MSISREEALKLALQYGHLLGMLQSSDNLFEFADMIEAYPYKNNRYKSKKEDEK